MFSNFKARCINDQRKSNLCVFIKKKKKLTLLNVIMYYFGHTWGMYLVMNSKIPCSALRQLKLTKLPGKSVIFLIYIFMYI